MHEVIDTGEEGVVDAIAVVHAAVVLDLEAERSEGAVLPEVQATGDLEVGAARREDLAVRVFTEIVVDEEEGVSPIVVVETLEGCGYVLAVRPEIIEDLEIGLCLCSLGKKHCGRGDRHQS